MWIAITLNPMLLLHHLKWLKYHMAHEGTKKVTVWSLSTQRQTELLYHSLFILMNFPTNQMKEGWIHWAPYPFSFHLCFLDIPRSRVWLGMGLWCWRTKFSTITLPMWSSFPCQRSSLWKPWINHLVAFPNVGERTSISKAIYFFNAIEGDQGIQVK